jgi:hypothetical protein
MALSTACNTQLIVSGALVADNLVLERSVNTLSDSTGDDPTSVTSSAAEQVTYNPSVWAIQPPSPTNLTYNTIVDLPPVL